MTPNKVDVTMQPLDHPDSDDACYVTGAICPLLISVTTANTLKPMSTGAYLEVKLEDDFLIRGTKCWAKVDQIGTDLDCFKMSSDTFHIRLPDRAQTALQRANNKINIIIQSVRMPLSTAPVKNPIVQNFEFM